MKIFFTLLTFLGLSLSVFSQPCSGGFESIATDLNFGSGGAIVLATAATSSQTVANVAAGEYVRVYVCAGTSYTFSTCTSVSLLNSEISINDDTGTDAFGQYDDDGCGDVGGHASLTWVATVTGIVQVLVTENTALGGACDTNPAALFDLTITSATPCGPDGASCDFPIIVNADSYASGLSSTCDFGNAYDDSMIGCPGENFYLNGNDVVYTFTPSTTQSYEFSLLNPDVVSMGYFVFDACPDAGGNCLINDGSGIGDALAQDVNLTAGTTYYVVVSSNPADATNGVECGNYELNIIPSPPGKTCDAPFVIPTASFSQTGFTTCGFGDDYDTAPGCDIDDNFIGGDDFVMEYTASVSGCYDINLTNGDSFLGLFVSTTCPPTNCDAYAESGNTPSLQTNVYLEAGQTYYFTISTEPAPQCSPFDFSITECTADGEDCNTPAVISSGATAGLTTCGMGDNYSDADACGSTFMNGEEAIYNFTVPADGCYDISFANVSNTAADFGAFVLDGCPDAGATCIAQGGQSAGTPTVTANLTAGITYTLVVATSDCANFDLNIDNVTCPVGVNCANPQGVTIGANGPFDMTASGDDYDNGDGCGSIYLGGNDYVMTFTPTATDCYNFTTSSGTGFNPDTDLGLFILSDCPDAIGVQCIAQNEVDNGFPMADAYLNASQTYYIIIGAIEQDTPLPGFFSNSETIFNINISGGGTSCPPGANCSNPEIVNTGTNGPFDGCGAGNDYDSSVGCNNFYMNGEDFVMTFTPSATDCYDIIVNGTANSNPDADVGLFVLTDCPDIATECVIEETAANGFPMGTAVLQAGQIYYVVVSAIEIITPLTENSSCTEFTLDINAGSVNCPVGETCANPLVIPSLGTYSGLTSCGSGDDYDNTQAANCSTGVDHYLNGEDFVMTFTPSSSGCHNFQFSNPTDPDADSGVFIYDGCPDANPNCVGFGVDENGVPDNVLTDLTAGTTYYVVFSAVELTGAPGTGLVMPSCNGFDMEVSTCDPPQPIQDCIGAIPVCQGTYVYNDGFLGDGNNPNEAPNGSCLLDNELNSIWFVITADSDGDFSFLITPMNGTDDYDFGVYDITAGGCAGIGSGASPQLSCSYAQSPGATGAGPIPGLNDQDATGTLINGAIPVTTGQTLALLISNFSGSSTGFTLDLTLSTADVFDESPPTIASITDPVTCGATTFDVELSEPIDCSTFAPCDFNVVFPDGSNHALTDVTAGSGCAAGNPFEQNFTFTVDAPMDQDGTYTLEIGNGCSGISDNCGNIQTNTSITFDVMGITCMIVSQMDETCTNGMGSLEVSASDGTTYTYTLDGGMSQTTGLYTGLSAGMYTVVATDDITGCTCSEMITIADVGTPPTINNVMTMDANCGNADGEVTFEINGGTPPYTVTVGADTQMGNDPFTFTGISSGTGSIDVTDDTGCTASTTFIINDAGGPTIDSVVPADATCGNDDGSAVVTISGGSPDYTVTIDGVTVTGASPVTVTGLSVGTHSVDVADANGCMTSGSVTIDEADSPMIDSAVPTNSTCGNVDGQIVVTVSGGMANYTVDIGGGITQTDTGPTFTFTGLAASTYNITVTDMNGCTATGSATIMDAGGPMIDMITPTDATCGMNNGSVEVVISGGVIDYSLTVNGVTVSGSSPLIISGLPMGTYPVEVEDMNGCMVTGSVTINDSGAPTIDMTTPTNSTCGNSDGSVEVTISGGTAPYTVDLGGGNMAMGASPVTVTGLMANAYTITVTDAAGCTATGNVTIMDAGGPMIDTVTPTDATCGAADGSVEVAISSGTAPYTLTVNMMDVSGASPLTINGLMAGTYPVTIEDANGCMATSSVTIDDAGSPMIDNVVSVDANCMMSNGSLTINVSGGVTPYTYDVNSNIQNGNNVYTNLPAGAYTILVTDANGCSVTGNATINNIPGITIDDVAITDANCGQNDGSITVSVSGGPAPINFNFNNINQTDNGTFNGVAAGNYILTVTDDNSCTATQNVTIDDVGGITLDDIVIVDAACGIDDGTATINITGGSTPITYTLNGINQIDNNVFTDLAEGNYNVTITDDNGCTATGTTTIGGSEAPVIDNIMTVDANCGQADGSATINATGGTPPYSYSLDGTIQNDPNNQYTSLASGNYDVIVTDANGCTVMGTASINDAGGATIDGVDITDATCGMPTGQFTVNVSGGMPPYMITANGVTQTDPLFTGLMSGIYPISVVDASGCETTTSATVGNIPGVQIDDIMTTDASCGQADGSKTIIVSGGNAPYTFECNGIIQVDNGVFTGMIAGNYVVTVTDNDGCTATGSATINDADGPTIDNVVEGDANCGMPNGTLTINANPTDGLPPFMYTVGMTTQANNIFTGLLAGTYNPIVTDANGCTATLSATIDDISGVQIDDITTIDATCGQADGSKTIVVSGGTAPYTFECNGTIQVDNGTFTGLMAGSYPVTVTDANGCTATGNASINDADGPTIDSAIATDANCGMSNGTITVTISGGATPYNVTVNGETLQTTETIIFDDLPAGDYGIEVVDANGCGASSSAEIIDISGVMLNDIIVLDASCGQADGSKNIMVSGGNAPYTFTCGALTQTDNGLFENLPAGVYPWTVTDADGCMIDGTTTINDANGPSIDNVTVTDATNGNNDGSIAITISGGLPPYTVNVNATDMTTNDMVTFNGIGAGTYPVTVTDANGCTATGTATVNEGGCPVIDDIIVMNATCGNADGTITIEASGGATPLMYSIDGGVTFENNNIFNNLLADDYNIVIQDAAGCQVTGLATIMNLGAPSITDISTMDANCGQADGSITITAMGGTGGLMYSNDGGMNFQASNVFSNLPAGNYDIVVQDALGCEIADLASIQNLDAPVINDIMTTDVNCGNDDGSITINAMGGAAPLTYLVNGMPSVDNNNVFNNMSAGNYDIQVIDDNGCEVNATAEIMDDGAPIITNVNTTNASCGNADGTITISANGGLAPLMYSIDDGVTFQAGNIFNVSGGNYDPIVSDANGCTETNPTVTVNEDDAPIIDNIMEVDATCGNMDGSVTITVSGGVAPYTFDINGNIMTDPATATFTGLGAGIYTINIMDANGCTVIGSATIDDLNGPMIDNVSVMDATNGNADGSFTVTATGGTPPYTFEANGQMMNDASMATFTGLAAGNYPFTITDANGCMAASSATINEGECPTIDDITTTNADCGMATGTITVTATGGVAPLLYQLDNGTASANNVFTGVTGGMHTITVTDAAGCMISEMVTVDENGGATIDDVTVTGSTCDENNGTAVVTVSGGMMPYSYTINGIQQAENTFDNLQPGNYTVTVTDANDCEAMQMFTINDLAAPVVDDVVVLNASCGNTDGGITILATGGNGTLMYSIDGGMNFQVSNIFTGLAAGGYDYAVMDDNCTVTGVVAVSNDGAPEITSIDATDASCGTADGTLTVNTMGGTPPLTYTVNMIDQVDDNVFTGLPAGDYTVVVEDANGCVGSTVATIIESGTLTVNILGNLTICDGTTTLLTADPANAGYDFEWSTGSLTNETAVSTAGTVTLVATLGNCIGMTSVEVVVADLPTANAGADVTLDCDNPTAMLDGSGSMGNNLTYNWTTMDGTIVGANDISTIEINSGGTYILEVTEDIAGCTDLDTVIVTQNAVMPTADAGADMEITCLIQAVTLDGSGSSANVNYSWTGPGITAANMNQQSPQVTQAGDYVLTVTNITSNCTATDMVTVTEDVDMPIADIAVVVPIDCSNTTLDIDGSNSSAGPEFTYQWLDENMNPIAGETNSILTVDSEGIYTLQVTNTTNGCVSSETVIVDDLTVFPLTVAQVSGVLTCDVLEVDLDGSGSQTGATIIYEWVDAAGNLVGNNLVETVSEIGFYTLTITDTDSECFNEITIEVTQNLTAPEAVAGSDIALDCLDPTVILDGSESDQGPNFTYFWNADNGQTINGETTLTPTVSESGIYRIVVTDSENGCTSENFVVVSENVETPTGMGLSFDLPDCEGDENGLIFVDSIQGGIGPFVYAIDGGGFSASPIFNSLTAGDYEITVQSPGGCTYSEVATLEDGYDLMVDLGEDIFINLGDEADIEAVVNIGPLAIDTIIWEANDTLCINCYEQTVTPMMTMNYNVQVVDENGCIADDDLTIFVNQNVDLFMPNIFSPNGDNRNQFFYPQAVEGVIQNISSIEIFNRWGDLVFETSDIMPNDPEAGWDGTFNGRTLSPQVFVYRIEAEFINGNTKVFSGDVTLVK